MMESSVKSISKPVIDRLPVNQLDEFACRQLDRVSDLNSFVWEQISWTVTRTPFYSTPFPFLSQFRVDNE